LLFVNIEMPDFSLKIGFSPPKPSFMLGTQFLFRIRIGSAAYSNDAHPVIFDNGSSQINTYVACKKGDTDTKIILARDCFDQSTSGL
jgi:hypothetical protein